MTLEAVRRAVPLVLLLSAVGCPGPPPEPGDPLDGLDGEERRRFEAGRTAFERSFEPGTGLGPLFNSVACATCHGDPDPGGASGIDVVHATMLTDEGFCDPLADRGGPVYQLRVTPALREALGIEREPIPPEATDTAVRSSPDLFGFGLLDAVRDETLEALADPDDADGDGISGRLNRFFDGRIGRFGRKALVPTLSEFNAGAFQIEQGVTTPQVPNEGTVAGQPIPPEADPAPDPELNAEAVASTDDFVRFLAPPAPADRSGVARRGERVFSDIRCDACHLPTLRTGDHPVDALSNREVRAYTDLLLHDMGPELADICLGLEAGRSEFRTEPLMGLRLMRRFLHDGRATTIEEAVRLHGGEAAASRAAFEALPEAAREALLEFLRTL